MTLMLQDFITANRDEIVRRARMKASTRSSLRPTDADLDKGIPIFLDELNNTLRRTSSQPDVNSGHATEYGGHLQRMGFTVAQVVHGYGDVCQTVTELAIELNASITVEDFRVFNRCLDESIAEAVTEYGRRREGVIVSEGTERVAVLAHELRNSLQTAMLAFSVLKRGSVGTDSSTATLLNRSLTRLHDILERSLSEVKLESGALKISRVVIATLIEDIEIASSLEAANRGMTFTVVCDPNLQIDGDALLLSGALGNLIQNAFKFSKPNSRVSLTIHSKQRRVFFDVEDQCGGLPAGKGEELFRLFEQRGEDRSGLGVGLAVAQTSARAMKGEVRVRDLPPKGCVFTIDLPLAQPLT